MNLMMFDVDGTLVRSNEYDGECYVNAVSTTLGISVIDTVWENYEHVSNSGVSVDGIPLASADDALSRVDIMKASLCKAEKVYEQSTFKSVTYVRDATWDLKASMELGWHFIAVGEPILSYVDDRPQFWVKDFTDDQVMSAILEKIHGMA